MGAYITHGLLLKREALSSETDTSRCQFSRLGLFEHTHNALIVVVSHTRVMIFNKMVEIPDSITYARHSMESRLIQMGG